MDESMRVPVISTIEGLSANFAKERFFTRVNPSVLFEMFRINEGGLADVTLEGALAGMDGLDMII